VILKSGTGNAKIIVKAKGANLLVPGLPYGVSDLKIQLVRNFGGSSVRCWEADFGAPLDDGTTLFKDKTP
jgi:hypothetical protein